MNYINISYNIYKSGNYSFIIWVESFDVPAKLSNITSFNISLHCSFNLFLQFLSKNILLLCNFSIFLQINFVALSIEADARYKSSLITFISASPG